MANGWGFAMAAAIGVCGDYDAARLRELAKRSDDANQTRRLLALAAIYDGGSRTEAAKMGCVGLQTVRDWVLAFNAEGRNVDYRAARGLDRALFQALTAGRWIEEAQNLIIEGPAGVGKSWLACALGHKACRDNRSVLYQRIPRMFSDLALARGDGRYPRLMRALGGVKLLILDDWGLEPLGPEQRHDLLEIVEDRYGRGATLITSQIPVDRWHDLIGEPTLADAILDRIIHNAHRLQLKGDSLRKQRGPKTAAA